MKFCAREKVAAPLDAVFAKATEFDRFEVSARARGVEVARRGTGAPTIGTEWDVAFDFMGKRREGVLTLVECDPCGGLRADGRLDGFTADFSVDLMSLVPDRTEMTVALEVKAQGLASRLVLQSLKLAATDLSERFGQMVAEAARTLESRAMAETSPGPVGPP
jgi:hypothetical protein